MNKKQFKSLIEKFLLGSIVGFVCGLALAFMDISGINLENLKNLDLQFLIIIPTIVGIVITILLISLNKELKADNYSDDENSVFAKKEIYLLKLQTTSTIFQIVNMLLFGANINLADFSNETADIKSVIFVICMFTINVGLLTYLEVYSINILKKVQPEKNADPTKTDYNTKALDTLDELELKNSGKSAIKTLGDMVKVNAFLFFIGIFTSQKPMFFVGLCVPWAISIALNTFHNINECTNKE